jgi:hypothetical protein
MRFLLGVLLGYSMRGKKRPLITVLTALAFIVYVLIPGIALLALRLDVQRERRMRPTQIQVPAVKGLSYEDAETKLRASNLNIRVLAILLKHRNFRRLGSQGHNAPHSRTGTRNSPRPTLCHSQFKHKPEHKRRRRRYDDRADLNRSHKTRIATLIAFLHGDEAESLIPNRYLPVHGSCGFRKCVGAERD